MKTNPYHKKCPHCSKEFNARRLNQKYCTYFCKIQFNNEKARLRRLELLEIAKNHENEISRKLQKSIPKNTINSSLPSVKPMANIFQKRSFMMLIFFAICGIGITCYYFFKPKNKPSFSPQAFDKQKNEPLNLDLKTSGIPPIPMEIISFSLPQSEEKNKSPHQEEHPDISAYKKILKSHEKT